MKERPLTKQLAPLIVFIVLIIVLTVIIKGSSFSSARSPRMPVKLEMGLTQFNYQLQDAAAYPSERRPGVPDAGNALSAAVRDCESGEFARAEDRIRTALLFYPANRSLLSLLGATLYRQRKYGAAEAVFRHLTALNPDDTIACANLSAALAGQKRFAEAVEIALQVYRKQPDSPVAALNLSGIYAMSGHTAEAMKYFKKAYNKLGENILPLVRNAHFDPIRKNKAFVGIIREAEACRARRQGAASR